MEPNPHRPGHRPTPRRRPVNQARHKKIIENPDIAPCLAGFCQCRRHADPAAFDEQIAGVGLSRELAQRILPVVPPDKLCAKPLQIGYRPARSHGQYPGQVRVAQLIPATQGILKILFRAILGMKRRLHSPRRRQSNSRPCHRPFIDQQHIRAGFRGRQRGPQAGSAAADHQHSGCQSLLHHVHPSRGCEKSTVTSRISRYFE